MSIFDFFSKGILVPLSLLLLAACSGKAAHAAPDKAAGNTTAGSASARVEQTASSDSELPKSMTADISGDYTEHFSATDGKDGEAVQIGASGSISKDTARFTITGLKQGPTQSTDVTIGFIVDFSGFPVGTQLDCRGAFVRLLQGGNETSYNAGTYLLFYETRPYEDVPPPIAHVTFSKADKLPPGPGVPSLGIPGLPRYHLVGTFDFQAAYAPDTGHLSDACIHEAQEAVLREGRHPPYKADLCGAKKISVRGNFDITTDLPPDLLQ